MDFKQFILLQESKEPDEIGANLLKQAIPEFWNNYLKSEQNENTAFEISNEKFKSFKGKSTRVSNQSKSITNKDIEATQNNETLETINFKGVSPEFIKNISSSLINVIGENKLIPYQSSAISPSEFWIKITQNKSDSKPKTTFLTENEQYKINFSMFGGFRLFSPSKTEALATFYAAFEETKNKPKDFEDVIDLVKTSLKTIKKKEGYTITQMRNAIIPFLSDPKEINSVDAVKSAQVNTGDLEEIKDLMAKLNIAQNIHKELQKSLNTYFNNNLDFKSQILIEALSGKYKYGQKSSGTANYLMGTWPQTGISRIRKIDNELGLKLANNSKIKVRVDFKPDRRGAYGEVKIASPTTGEEHAFFGEEFIAEEFKNYILSESIIGEIKNWFTNFFNWLLNKLILIFKKGLDYAMTFFGIAPDVTISDDLSDDDLYNALK